MVGARAVSAWMPSCRLAKPDVSPRNHRPPQPRPPQHRVENAPQRHPDAGVGLLRPEPGGRHAGAERRHRRIARPARRMDQRVPPGGDRRQRRLDRRLLGARHAPGSTTDPASKPIPAKPFATTSRSAPPLPATPSRTPPRSARRGRCRPARAPPAGRRVLPVAHQRVLDALRRPRTAAAPRLPDQPAARRGLVRVDAVEGGDPDALPDPRLPRRGRRPRVRQRLQVDQPDRPRGLPRQMAGDVRLVHRRHRVPRHHRVAVEPRDAARRRGEQVAERLVAAHRRRRHQHRHPPRSKNGAARSIARPIDPTSGDESSVEQTL